MEEWDRWGRTADPELVPYGKGIPPTVKQLAHITWCR
jgi:glutamate-1-semialdehyde 2,1-aminomutase